MIHTVTISSIFRYRGAILDWLKKGDEILVEYKGDVLFQIVPARETPLPKNIMAAVRKPPPKNPPELKITGRGKDRGYSKKILLQHPAFLEFRQNNLQGYPEEEVLLAWMRTHPPELQ